MVSDELVTETKVILHNLRASGGVITQKTVIATGNEVLISRYPEKLTKNSGSVTLTTKWARGILKSLDWIKRRVATAKRKMNPALYDKFSFTSKKKMPMLLSNTAFIMKWSWILIKRYLVLLRPTEQLSLKKCAQSEPIANVDYKHQITGTFCVNISGEFLPIQLIYSGVTE